MQHRGQDQGVLAARPDLRGQDTEAGEEEGEQVAKVLRALPGLELQVSQSINNIHTSISHHNPKI